MQGYWAVVLALWYLISNSEGHICLLRPLQRGGVETPLGPGSLSCFQPQAPCGSVQPNQPKALYIAGQTISVSLQQNLNHYNPGHPGFIDVAWAKGDSPADSDFTRLAIVPDYWSHDQGSQTNFSIPVTIPDVECDHCTLRVRYHPNKPTEPIFHNCADFAITKNSPVPSHFGSLFALSQTSQYTASNTLAQISASGDLMNLPLEIDVRLQANGLYLADGLLASDPQHKQIYFVGGSIQDWENGEAPRQLFRYDISSKVFSHLSELSALSGAATALVTSNSSSEPIFLVEQVPNPTGQEYAYQIRTVSTAGALSQPLVSSVMNNTYVNFFWADYAPMTNKLYILAGDENSPFKLNAVLYIFDITARTSSWVQLSNSQFTLSSFSIRRSSGELYSVSPGLYGGHDYTLVKINPQNGSVTAVAASFGQEYLHSYGGSVYGSIGEQCGMIMHVFQTNDGAYELVALCTDKGGSLVYKTGLQQGINEATKLKSFLFVPQS